MFNQVTLIGNLGKDPESKTLSTGTLVCVFSLATTSKRKDASGQTTEETQWHNIVVWSKLAEICQQYLKKGSKAMIQGTIKYSEYEKDGVKKYRTEIHATDMKMLDTKAASEQRTTAQEPAAQTPVDDDLPF